MTGGTINVAKTFGDRPSVPAVQVMYLSMAALLRCGALNMTTDGRLDITAGTLIVNGDATYNINGYMNNGWITAYGGSGTFRY